LKQSTLGSCIRTLRVRNNMTQAQLAGIVGVTDKAVSKWERDLSYPDIFLFPMLADVLGTSVDDLLRECKEEYRRSKLVQTFEMTRDIRVPLHVILGFAEIIRNNHDDPEMLQRYLEGIRISGEYMMEIFNRMQKDRSGSGDEGDPLADYSYERKDLDEYLMERISTGQTEQPVYHFDGRRILVAEDMTVNREIAGEILKRTGAETEFAEDGLICLNKIKEAPAGYYDLILMDIMMPVMDGIEATRRIRHLDDPAKSCIPIIAMTTNVSEEDRSAALAAGMNGFEEKPIRIDKLFMSIGHYLNEK